MLQRCILWCSYYASMLTRKSFGFFPHFLLIIESKLKSRSLIRTRKLHLQLKPSDFFHDFSHFYQEASIFGIWSMSAAKNQAKMASDNQDRSDKKEVMQSNLPLLFANGSPISLESMNLVSILTFLLVTTYHRPYRRDISDYCNIGVFFPASTPGIFTIPSQVRMWKNNTFIKWYRTTRMVASRSSICGWSSWKKYEKRGMFIYI